MTPKPKTDDAFRTFLIYKKRGGKGDSVPKDWDPKNPIRFEDEYPLEAGILMDIYKSPPRFLDDDGNKVYLPLHFSNQKFEKRAAGLGRNNLCPCGSGIKFKKCCL